MRQTLFRPAPAFLTERRNRLARLFRSIGNVVARLMPSLTALCVVASVTWISFNLHLELASVGFFYLVCVVVVAVYGGFWQATCISVISVACLDYFFDEPIFSFAVGRVANWVELVAFEFTAVVISQLSNQSPSPRVGGGRPNAAMPSACIKPLAGFCCWTIPPTQAARSLLSSARFLSLKT